MFDYTLDYKNTDFRANPHLYRVGKGEQGVLLVEPYKSEILPFWRFKTPEIAHESSEKIYELFLAYKEQQDFVGMDMARKFLQMGYTRARRYANHRSGKKYEPQQDGTEVESGKKRIRPQEEDWATSEKAESARIFYAKYQQAKNDPEYLLMLRKHKEHYEK
ncbi:MAG TPA: DUF4385 domain-containing protein [Ktedonobacteraceae bacterium]|nr:DUF4385 domain-containing protein [Ktedonobacteraceae bacterium]